jgi:hypothetical protein
VKRRTSFSLIFAVSILCGFFACHKIQIAPEARRPQEKAQQKKTTQEKTIPQAVPQKEATQEKTIRQAVPQQEATQEKTIRQAVPQQEATQEKGFLAGIFQRIIPQDTFTRIYAINFASFHGQANAALQDHAKTHKGNSFQISRVGSDAVILRGVYLREGGREKYVSILTIKPIASQKCQLEIKFDSSAGGPSSPHPDEAAKEIFQIIEKATGRAAQ